MADIWYGESKAGDLYEISNGFAGATSTTAWLTPVAAAAATCLSLWNSSATSNLVIKEVGVTLLSGTVAIGAYNLNFHYNCTAISATANAIHRKLGTATRATGTASIGVGRGFAATAITAGLVGYEGVSIGQTPAVVGSGKAVREFHDGLLVGPYDMVTIGAPTAAASAVIHAYIVYSEKSVS